MSHLGQPMPFYLASWGLSQTILGNFGPAHAALSGSLGSICNHVGPSWGSPCRCIWLVGVQLEPFLTILGQPVPLYLACRCTSWPILRASWAVLDSSWAISGDLGRISGLLGFISDYFCQTVPFYLVCWGPSWPILASPCRFIWFVGVHPGPCWPAHAISSGLLGSILANLGQPVPFHLACLGPSWSHLGQARAVFLGFLGSILNYFGAAHAVLSAFLGSILGHFKPFWASPCRHSWFVGGHFE